MKKKLEKVRKQIGIIFGFICFCSEFIATSIFYNINENAIKLLQFVKLFGIICILFILLSSIVTCLDAVPEEIGRALNPIECRTKSNDQSIESIKEIALKEDNKPNTVIEEVLCPVRNVNYEYNTDVVTHKLEIFIGKREDIKEVHIICYGRNGYGNIVNFILSKKRGIIVKLIVYYAKYNSDIWLPDDDKKIEFNIKEWLKEEYVTVIASKIPPMIRGAVVYGQGMGGDKNKLEAIWGAMEPYCFEIDKQKSGQIYLSRPKHSLIDVCEDTKTVKADFKILVNCFEEEFERLKEKGKSYDTKLIDNEIQYIERIRKVYFIVLDGAADCKIKLLDNKTPLEVAKTNYLDQLSKNGMMSLIQILPQEYVPETDSGLMALLGYDPLDCYCGRGGLEAMGFDRYKNYKYVVGFRVNFASYNDDTKFLDRRTARDLSDKELQSLTNEITEKVKLELFPKVEYQLISYGVHRGILCFYSNEEELSGNVSNTDPGFEKNGYFSIPIEKYSMEIKKCIPLDGSNAAATTAKLVNYFIEKSKSILENSPINKKRSSEGKCISNYLLVRDGGSPKINMPKFFEKFKRSISIFGELPCEKALAQLIDADFSYSKELELKLDKTHLSHLAKELIKAESNIVFCHLKGPDEPGHDHDPRGKVEAIELIDQYFIREIVEHLSKSDIVVITCDHATPCELGIHSNDRVPLLISGREFDKDKFQHMDESNAGKGSCPVKNAVDVMEYVLSH